MKSHSMRVHRAALAIAHARPAAVDEAVHADVLGLVHRAAPRRLARLHQVAGDLGLAVHHHALAGQAVQVDAMALAAEAQLHAVVRQAFGVHARAHAELVEQVDRHLLEHAGADAAEHVFAAALLEQSRCRCPPGSAGRRATDRPGRRRRWRLGCACVVSSGCRWGSTCACSVGAAARALNGRMPPPLAQFEHRSPSPHVCPPTRCTARLDSASGDRLAALGVDCRAQQPAPLADPGPPPCDALSNSVHPARPRRGHDRCAGVAAARAVCADGAGPGAARLPLQARHRRQRVHRAAGAHRAAAGRHAGAAGARAAAARDRRCTAMPAAPSTARPRS